MAVHEDVSGRKWAARELLRSRQELEELRAERKEGQTRNGV
jgi:hypothetical protein